MSASFAQTTTTLNENVIQSLPQLGDDVTMSPQEERKLGDSIAQGLFASNQYLQDPVIQSYVNGVLKKLMAASIKLGNLTPEIERTYAWRILLLKDKTVNAFALPGGYFGLNLGLVVQTDDTAELASVLAHELSHVTQRHIARIISQQKVITPLVIGSMLAGLLAASSNPQAASALMVGGQALGAQTQINFTRNMEKEADRIGFQVLVKAGYNPRGFVDMFKKLQKANELQDTNDFPYLSDHPVTAARIADMQNRLGLMGITNQEENAKVNPSFTDTLIRSRAKVLLDSTGANTHWLAEATSKNFAKLDTNSQLGILYAAALSQGKSRHFDQAQKLVEQLIKKTEKIPKDGAFSANQLARLLQAEIFLMSDQPNKTLKSLAALNASVVNDRAYILLWAQAADASAQKTLLSQGAQSLQMWVTQHPSDTLAWQILGSIYSHQGKVLESMRALAEESSTQLNFSDALARLQAAAQWAKDHRHDNPPPSSLTLSIITSKIAAMKQKLGQK